MSKKKKDERIDLLSRGLLEGNLLAVALWEVVQKLNEVILKVNKLKK